MVSWILWVLGLRRVMLWGWLGRWRSHAEDVCCDIVERIIYGLGRGGGINCCCGGPF